MPINRIAIGEPSEASHPAALRAALAEFLSMAIFVFAGQGSTMAISKNYPISASPIPNPNSEVLSCTFFSLSADKITDDGPASICGLLASALAHAFALSVAITAAANISGGHVNPAVTFSAFICGNITLLRSIMYWIAQLLGSVVACVLLKSAAGGTVNKYKNTLTVNNPRDLTRAFLQGIAAFSISDDVSTKSTLLFEIVMTFGLVYTVYATAIETRKSSVKVPAPMAIGGIMGANILVAGAFVGVSMNPALAFGPAIVSWSWAGHWVYWAGPMLGAALAALVYDTFFVTETNRDRLPIAEY